MRNPLDCPGCAKRREIMAQAARKIGDWMIDRLGPPPDVTADTSAANTSVPTDAERIERFAILLFRTENKASENDWRTATDGLRENYRRSAREKMEIKS